MTNDRKNDHFLRDLFLLWLATSAFTCGVAALWKFGIIEWIAATYRAWEYWEIFMPVVLPVVVILGFAVFFVALFSLASLIILVDVLIFG